MYISQLANRAIATGDMDGHVHYTPIPEEGQDWTETLSKCAMWPSNIHCPILTHECIKYKSGVVAILDFDKKAVEVWILSLEF